MASYGRWLGGLPLALLLIAIETHVMNIQDIPDDAIGLTHEGVHMIVWFAGGEFHATDFEFVSAARKMRLACQCLCDVRDAVATQRKFIHAVPSLN